MGTARTILTESDEKELRVKYVLDSHNAFYLFYICSFILFFTLLLLNLLVSYLVFVLNYFA